MFLNDTKCAHSSRFKGKGNCHQHRVTRAAQTAVTRLISVTCFMVHALMFVRLGRRCNIGLLLSVPLKLLKLWLRLIPDTLFTPQVTVCACAARQLQRLLLLGVFGRSWNHDDARFLFSAELIAVKLGSKVSIESFTATWLQMDVWIKPAALH